MTDYLNPGAKYPLPFRTDIPGISLPGDFALEAADRSLDGPNLPNGQKPKAIPASEGDRVRFPLRDRQRYGEAIARLVESFSGPGFNLIFRPHSDQSGEHGPGEKEGFKDPELLELNLTHELWTFPTLDADLGNVPNRVTTAPKDMILRGIPYTQLVRDVTAINKDKTGERVERIPVDRLGKNSTEALQNMIQDIHFEPGLLMHVEHSLPVSDKPTINRMASIPHGTTINAQGPAAILLPPGTPQAPLTPDIPLSNQASKPFSVNTGRPITPDPFHQFNLSNPNTSRLPKTASNSLAQNPIESITQAMVLDPNELLREHNKGRKFTQVIKFTVSTVPTQPLETQACPHLAARAAMEAAQRALTSVKTTDADAARVEITKALGIVTESPPVLDASSTTAPKPVTAFGSANIAFLDGDARQGPNARTGKVTSTFWISTVEYTLTVAERFIPGTTTPDGKPKILQLKPEEFGKLPKDTVPEFIFPTDKEVLPGRYKVEATQVQYSQNVSLVFNRLVWPHISVATVVPVRPVLVKRAVLDTSGQKNRNELRL